MSTTRFTAEISEDQTIHPPEGIHLIPGKADVIVVQSSDADRKPADDDLFVPVVPEIAKDLARFAHEQNIHGLPSDFAMNHDHYLHGAPKEGDQ